MKQKVLALMEQSVVSIMVKRIQLGNSKLYILGGGCDIKKILAKARYSNFRKRLTLSFSPNRQGKGASFQCKIDNQKFSDCKFFIDKYIDMHTFLLACISLESIQDSYYPCMNVSAYNFVVF